METITSRDGTAIAYERSGTGPPLVLVHGSTAHHTRWARVRPVLDRHFSVYAVDRRGRGESGDTSPYAIEREFDDIAAVVDSIAEPANLLGHSYGALCSLGAAPLTRKIRKLILYEPSPLPLPGVEMHPPGVVDRLQRLLDAGDREGVLTTFFREVVGMPPHELELMQSSPVWPARLAAAHTLPREVRAEEAYRFDAERFRNLAAPTLLLLGGDSPRNFRETIEAIQAALPDSRIVVMPGQQHIAMDTAPDLFVHEIVRFLTEAG